MYLRYQPEGSSEPTIYKFDPKKMMSAERELLEKKSGVTFEEFNRKLLDGSSVCRRALLFVFMKRSAPGVRYDDVDFAWDECELGLYRSEVEEMIAEVEKTEKMGDAEKAEAIAALNDMLPDAIVDDDAGKVPSKS